MSAWELTLLVDRGRFKLNSEPRRWISEALAKLPMHEAPLTFEVALAARDVVLPHHDPADRFLVATATVYDLTLVTADPHLLAGRGFRHMANR